MENLSGLENVNTFLWDNKKNVIVLYFGASWCGPCKKLKERLNNVNEMKDFKNIRVGYIDVDDDTNKEIFEIYEVSQLPTQKFIRMDDNKVIVMDTLIGFDWTGFRFKYNECTDTIINLN